MRKTNIIYLLLIISGLISCSKNEYTEIFPGENNLDSVSSKLTIDTLGVHPFIGTKYLVLSRKEQRFLYYAKQNDIMTLKALALPECDNSSLDLYPEDIRKAIFDCDLRNYFYGYASALDVNGKTLVIAERRASEKFTNSRSDNFFLTVDEELLSTDGDSIWQQTDFFKYAPYGNTMLNSYPIMGKTETGKIVVKSNGLLISDGEFDNWVHYPHAFDSLLDKDYEEHGPVITYSSIFGLFFGTGQYFEQKIDKIIDNKGAIIAIDVDNGVAKEVIDSWVPQILKYGSYIDIEELSTPVFYSVEHSDLSDNIGDIISFGISSDKVYQFVYNYKPGDTYDSIKFDIALTNIEGSLNRHSPVGINYNPVTKKFEIIHSSPYYLEIYSKSPEEVLSNELNKYGEAEWKLEALLLNRDVTVRGQGMHPVGNIIDVENGVQKIYIFAGDEYPGRAGIFEITRLLDTEVLSEFIATRRQIISEQNY